MAFQLAKSKMERTIVLPAHSSQTFFLTFIMCVFIYVCGVCVCRLCAHLQEGYRQSWRHQKPTCRSRSSLTTMWIPRIELSVRLDIKPLCMLSHFTGPSVLMIKVILCVSSAKPRSWSSFLTVLVTPAFHSYKDTGS